MATAESANGRLITLGVQRLSANPRDWIIGDAFFTYWPPDRIGFF
jgi:hypothetical protein